ncbi:MBL fold metallo-hydrolase [Sporosarcina sp. CAU 1771]
MISKLFVHLLLYSSLFMLSACSVNQQQTISKADDVASHTPKDVQDDIDHSKMKVHFIDVGQADATLLQFNDGNEAFTLLFDTGDWISTDVVSYLHSQQVKDIDIIAISHPHADHIGQLDKIIADFNVGEVWMNGEISNSQVFAKSLEAIETYQVDYYEPTLGEVFDIGLLEITVIHPKSLSMGTNDNSLVFRLQYGDISFLLTGDAEQQAENEMLGRGENLQATVLHAGHHGSKTSTTPNFLAAVKPEIAIYSAGENNSYGHPDAEIVDRITGSGTLLYGTDTHGTIVLETDGKTIEVKTQKQGTIIRNENCLNINTATLEEVQQITHIGPTLAAELIKLRPFHSIDELVNINGIGSGRLNDIKAQGVACIGG